VRHYTTRSHEPKKRSNRHVDVAAASVLRRRDRMANQRDVFQRPLRCERKVDSVIPWVAVISALSGYAVGSIPFALLVVRLFGGGRTVRSTELSVPGTGKVLRSDAVSATAVRLQMGAPFGCLTSLLDMSKAAAVTLTFKYLDPEAAYYLIAAGFAVVGHVWPVFHRFRGGRGQSPIIGSLFVIDWPAAFIAYPCAQVLGLVTRSTAWVGRFSPPLIVAGWLYFRFRNLSFVYFALGLFLVRLLAMRREMAQYAAIRKSGGLRTLSEQLELLRFSPRVIRAIDRIHRCWSRCVKHRAP